MPIDQQKPTNTVTAYVGNHDKDYQKRLGSTVTNPLAQAVIRKIVPDIDSVTGMTERTRAGMIDMPDVSRLLQISGGVSQDATDATSLMQLLPDLKLVENLLVSLILSPRDLTSTEINFTVDPHSFNLPVSGRLLEIVREIFTNDFDLKRLAPQMLKDALFRSGSYPLLILPENAIDELINGKTRYSNEAFSQCTRGILDAQTHQPQSLNLLGPSPMDQRAASRKAASSWGLEGFLTEPTAAVYNPAALSLGQEMAQYVLITDNFNMAKMGILKDAARAYSVDQAIHRASGIGMEGASDYVLGGRQRQRQVGQAAMVQAVRTKDMIGKPTVGHPLVLKIPSESVIPVYINPEKHLGYFLLMDNEGHFLATANRKDIYNDLSTQNNGTGSSTMGASQMIEMAKNLSIGVDPTERNDRNAMARIYGQLLENELKARLRGGVYGEAATLKASSDIYEIMLARTMKRMLTQVLYVPAELMVYVAFDYADNGTGRSLVEQSKIIGSMRAMLTFSGLMAGIKNSVSRQNVTIELSDNDIDPSKTLSRVMDEFVRRRNVTMPFVASDPADMISYINMAGVEFNVTGKGVPAHKVSVEDKVSNRAKVDQDLANELRDRHYMSFDLTPEAVVASSQTDFATTVMLQNQTQAKRVMTRQDAFVPFLEKTVRVISSNSAVVLNAFREAILTTLKEDALKDAIHSADADQKADQTAQDLPTPDTEGSSPSDAEPTVPPSATGLAAKPAPSAGKAVVDKAKSTKPALTEEEKYEAVETIISDFLGALRVTLPRPNTQTIEAQTAAFDQYSEAIDKALTMIIDPAFLTDGTLGEFAGRVDEIKAAYKAILMRDWMHTNGYLGELSKISSLDDEGKPSMDLGKESAEYAEMVSKGIWSYLDNLGKVKEAIKKRSETLDDRYPDAELSQGGGGGFGGSDTSASDSTPDDGDDAGADGDVGGGDDENPFTMPSDSGDDEGSDTDTDDEGKDKPKGDEDKDADTDEDKDDNT